MLESANTRREIIFRKKEPGENIEFQSIHPEIENEDLRSTVSIVAFKQLGKYLWSTPDSTVILPMILKLLTMFLWSCKLL